MQSKYLLMISVFVIIILLLSACGGTNTAPAGPTAPVPAANPAQSVSTNSGSNSAAAFKTQTVEGGSVSVAVTPIDLKAGALADFEIAMNTHSVDLSADMLKSVLLRDDSGKQYAPTKWDGPDGGGHHRSGRIEFPALPGNVRSVTLIVKDIAGIPERDYKWDVPQ